MVSKQAKDRFNKAQFRYEDISTKTQNFFCVVRSFLLPLIGLLCFVPFCDWLAGAFSTVYVEKTDVVFSAVATGLICLLIWGGMSISYIFAEEFEEKWQVVLCIMKLVVFVIMFFSIYATQCNPEDSFWMHLLYLVLTIVFFPLLLVFRPFVVLLMEQSFDGFNVIWVSLIVIAVFAGLAFCDLAGGDGWLTDKCSWVKKTRNEFFAAKREYEQEYNSVYPKAQAKYSSLYKVDTFAEKINYCPIPASIKSMEMVSNLIWCIENGYARDIVGARNWYLQQEQNQAVRDKLEGIAEENRRKAAAEAEFQAKLLKQMERDSQNMQKLGEEIAGGVKDIASSNRKISEKTSDIAYSADKAAGELELIRRGL